MRRMAIGLTAAAALIAVTSLSAQGKPNFAGKWTLQADANAAAAGAGGGGGRAGGGAGRMGGGMMGAGFCGAGCDITQDATTLTLKTSSPAGDATSTYKLDGSESANSRTMNMGGNSMTISSKSKVTFEGAKMNIATSTDFNGTARESSVSIWLENGDMVVESKQPGRQGGEPTVTKQTYKKS